LIAEDADEETIQLARARRANAVNSLGNLTLTNGRLNSTMRDSAWSTKEDHLRAKSTLLITTASVLSRPPKVVWHLERAWADAWTEDNIDARTTHLISLALDVWSRPDIDPNEDADLHPADGDGDAVDDEVEDA
jgi:alkylhydroperoxidase/carboxymuconolactone decarboxylase family protein YurZ